LDYRSETGLVTNDDYVSRHETENGDSDSTSER